MKKLELVRYKLTLKEIIAKYKHCYKYIKDLKDIQVYVDVIYNIIDECDYFSFLIDSEYTEKFYQNLKYVEYDNVYINNKKTKKYGKRILDITTKEAKQYLKDNIRFCICDPCGDREPIQVDIIHKNIENYDLFSLYSHHIFFIKGNRIMYDLGLYDGWLLEYKELNLREKIRKLFLFKIK